MSAPRDDDSEAVDRAFAEMVAHYHLTSDRPDPLPQLKVDRESSASAPSGPSSPPPVDPAPTWADEHPLFLGPEAAVPEKPRPVPEPEDRYVPDPQPPMARPRLPILMAWAGIAYAAMIVLLAAFGVRLPSWMGWIALGSFLSGFGVLVFNLPRSRPPDDDGAVL